MAYTTLAALKSFGGFEEDSEDDLLNALILSATQIVENHTDRLFEVAEETDQDFTRVTSVPTPSRFSGQTLYFHTELAEEASAITDSPTVIYLPETGAPYYGMHITDGAWAYPTVTVTGYWGHSKTPPPAIEIATLSLAKWLYDMRQSNRGDAVVVTPEGQVLLPKGLPQDVVTVLAPYKKVVVV